MTNQFTSSWPDDMTDRLRVLWADGLSARECAEKLFHEFPAYPVSRNAVIGKVHRCRMEAPMKLSSSFVNTQVRARLTRPALKAPPVKKGHANPLGNRIWPTIAMAPAASSPKASPPPPLRLVTDAPPTVVMEGLRAHHCRWPIGDPSDPAFGFCGAPKADHGPYCVAHYHRAYSPPTAKTSAKELIRSVRRYA